MAPFVGRQPELAVLQARLTEALTGRPQTVQIQGPAGIGKTALLEHFLSDSGVEPLPVVLSGQRRGNRAIAGVRGDRSAGALRRHPSRIRPSTGSRPATRHPRCRTGGHPARDGRPTRSTTR